MKRLLIVFLSILLFVSGCAHVPIFLSGDGRGKRASYHYILSEIETDLKNNDEALEHLEKAIEKDKGDPYLWYKRAILLASKGDLQGAEESILKALDLVPRDIPSLLLLGKIHQANGRRSEAIAVYQKALRDDPRSPFAQEATLLLMESYVAQKDYASALRLIESWERRSPDDTTPFFYEAWLAQNFLKNNPRLIGAYEKILKIEPDNVKALSSLADAYLEAKQTGKAIEIFRQMEAYSPNDATLSLKMALIYYEHKEYDRAVQKFEEVLEKNPEADRIIYYLGVIDENLKRYLEAEKQFKKIGTDSQFFKDARLHLALIYRGQGHVEDAISILEEAIRLDPDAVVLYEYLAEIFREEGNPEHSIDVLKRAIAHSASAEDREKIYYDLGLTYDKVGRFEESVATMKKVLKLNPKNAGALNYIGYSYADRGIHLDEAEALAQRALQAKPDDGYITDSLGWVYFKKGDLDQALTYVMKAYVLVPGEPTITEHVGDIYLAKKEVQKALRYYREALAILTKKPVSKLHADQERLRKKIEELQR